MSMFTIKLWATVKLWAIIKLWANCGQMLTILARLQLAGPAHPDVTKLIPMQGIVILLQAS